MNTIDIAVGDDRGKQTGTEQRRARPTPIPGLAITGARGCYVITHVRSGRRVCYASLHNYSASLDKIRSAMMIASGSTWFIDWTLDGDQLPKRQCEDWIRAFGGALAHS